MDRSGSLVRWLRTVLGAIALALGVGMVQAQTARVSPDLLAAISAPASTPPAVPWARVLPSGLHVQVLVNAVGTDPELTALRADILARGGSVIYNFISVRGLSAMVPAAAVLPLAGRATTGGEGVHAVLIVVVVLRLVRVLVHLLLLLLPLRVAVGCWGGVWGWCIGVSTLK